MRKDLIIAIMLTFCLTASIFMVATSQSAEYDPWVDLNDDGKIDIFDVVGMTSRYGATGDSTKYVSVTNWPVSHQQTVYWQLNASSGAGSAAYNASGYGHIHMTWRVGSLSGVEKVTLSVYARIYHDGGWIQYAVSSLEITQANDIGATSFPVPSEIFNFSCIFDVGTTASVNMAFYLTYA